MLMGLPIVDQLLFSSSADCQSGAWKSSGTGAASGQLYGNGTLGSGYCHAFASPFYCLNSPNVDAYPHAVSAYSQWTGPACKLGLMPVVTGNKNGHTDFYACISN